MTSIAAFKGRFGNPARATLFRVTGASSQGVGQKLEFTCKAAGLPASNTGVIEVPYMGRKIKVAGDKIFNEWMVTIINTEDMEVRKQIEDWFEKINSTEENTGPGDAEEYKTDIYVEQLDHQQNTIAKYKFVGAFPSENAQIDLAWDQNDSLEEFTVTFQYDYWVREQ